MSKKQPRQQGCFHNVWTREEVQTLTENWMSHTETQMAAMLPRFSLSAIRAKAHHLGLNKRNINKQVIAFEVDGIREFPNVRAAAQHYGLKENRIYQLISTGGETYGGVSFNYMI